MCTGIRPLLRIHPSFSFFFLSNLCTLKFFITLFSGTVRPRRLKLGTHMDSGQMYCVYRNQAAAAYSSLYVIFLSLQFSNIIIFVTLFSGTVRPRRLKLGTHMDIGWMYCVYSNQAATSYLSLISSVFFVSNVQKLKIFVTLFSGTVRPRKFKLGTLVDQWWIYRVYQNQAAAAYLSLYFFIFLPLQLSNRTFRHTFLRNCVA